MAKKGYNKMNLLLEEKQVQFLLMKNKGESFK